MRLGFELSLQQTQKLIMTQELRQAIQILQFTSQEMWEFVDKQIEVNPLIELESKRNEVLKKEYPDKENKINWKEYFRNNEYINTYYNKDKENDFRIENILTKKKSLKEHLLSQLYMTTLSIDDRAIAEVIIECIGKNGYLKTSIEEISKLMHITEDEIEKILKIIQTFDPVGVGSRNLKECLKIQVINKEIENNNIYEIIDNYLEDLAQNRLSKISKELNINLTKVQFICDLIKSLEPKPGRGFPDDNEDVRFVTPDVILKEIDSEYHIEVKDVTAPRLRINSYYRNLLQSDDDEKIAKYLNEKLNSAHWIIKSIEQRRTTLYNVVESILKFQSEFFNKGNNVLRPLTLKEVADDIDVHESTVSRATNGKYIQTPKGVYELKFFFTSGVSSINGGISSVSVKSIIKDLINNENTKKPLSDQKIANILKEKSIDISRRTVAKYRDELNIPSSTVRKRF